MNGYLVLLLGFGALLAVLGLVVWLKGTVSFVRDLSRATWQRRGEQWVQYALVEPILFLPFAFFGAAFRLARPDSLWARWFYSPRKLDMAGARYATANIEDIPDGTFESSRR